jgi:hypothetical protein
LRNLSIVVCLLCLFVTVPAMADMAQVKMTQGPGVGNGGAFNAEVMSGTISSLGPTTKFQTFCVELIEYFNPGLTYYADSRIAAYDGGAGGGNPDYLDPVTAALYTQYLGLNNLNDDIASQYQLAIWKIEQEIEWYNNDWVKFGTTTTIHSDYQQAKFDYTTAIEPLISGVGTPATIGNVRVMTLWSDYDPTNGCFSGNRQDQLVVPVPGAILLGMIGLSAAGLKLRRFA